jgi:hypothetical protein
MDGEQQSAEHEINADRSNVKMSTVCIVKSYSAAQEAGLPRGHKQ